MRDRRVTILPRDSRFARWVRYCIKRGSYDVLGTNLNATEFMQ